MNSGDENRDIELEQIFTATGQPVYGYEPSQDFNYLLGQTIKKARVSQALMIINIAIFALMVLSGVHMMQPQSTDVLKWGANFYPLTLNGEPWRLFTCMFLHFGLMHLAFNMWALKAVGEFIERLYGHRYFFFIYISSGLLASVNSLWWRQEEISISAGASGAVFGTFGALAAFVIRQRKNIPTETFNYLKSNLFMIIGINVVYGLINSSIDNAAHMGGLVSGFILAWCLTRPLGEVVARKRKFSQYFLATVFSLATFVMAWSSLSKAPVELDRFIQGFGQREKILVQKEGEVTGLMQAGEQRGQKKILRRLNDEVLQPWQEELNTLNNIRQKFKKKNGSIVKSSDKVKAYLEARIAYLEALMQYSSESSEKNRQDFDAARKALGVFLEKGN